MLPAVPPEDVKMSPLTPRTYTLDYMHSLAVFLCTGTAVLEFNYAGEACENFRTPSFWKEG